MRKQTSKLELPGKFDPQTRWVIGYFLVTLLVLWVWQGLIAEFAVRTIPYLNLHRDQHEQITAELLRHETIDGPRFYQLIDREMPRRKELVPPLALAVAVGEPQRGSRVTINTD